MKIGTVKISQLYFIVSFAVAIAAGTGLLRLSWCLSGPAALNWVDAWFTATSAVCVTGLETVPIADLSWIGQLIVLLLIQIGGLGIMMLTTSILVALGHELSHGGTLIMSTVSDRFSLRGTENLTRVVFQYTVICEGAGVVLLFPLFWLAEGMNWYAALGQAVFHAVSAFCNAGLSPLPAGVAALSVWTKLVIAALFICGGLGAYVVYDIRSSYRTGERLHAQTRLILSWTVWLLILGTISLWWLQRQTEAPVSLADAFFQSAACRTAGFATMDLKTLSAGGMVVIIILMLIGAAPGSTGGGMKVTTFALAAAGLYSTFKGTPRVILYKRMVPPENVLKAFVLLVTYVLLAVAGGLLLYGLTNFPLHWAMFESASALATVGLELGAPEEPVTMAGKMFLIVYMFIGRVGLFTFFLFLLGRERPQRLIYPEERMIVN